jgi:two-component system sensor histidine kinase CpxA
MHRLFTKIFLSFFATVLAISGLILATTYRRAPISLAPPLRALVEQAALKAAEAFENGDRETLGAATGVFTPNALLFNARGDAVSEVAPASQDLARAVTRRLAAPGQPVLDLLITPDVIVAPTVTATGERYYLAVRPPHERAIAVLAAVNQSPVLRLSIIALVALVMCFLLARHITAPLGQLRAATQQVAAGRLDAAAGSSLTTRRDEIGALGRDFNRMTEHLRDLDVAERRLLADVSHELRSPLARLTVALGLARQQQPDAPHPELDRIEREAGHLDRLIGQLLTLARAESGLDEHRREPIDVAALVDEVAADADFEARANGRSVLVRPSMPWRRAALPDLLRSGIENVVRNAVRHTAPGTTVEIDVVPSASCLSVAVRDHGPGVPEDELTTMFQAFRRGSTSAPGSSGAGLGLAIADRAMRRHGGSIEARNAESGGLVVTLSLPADVDVPGNERA